MEKFKTHFFNHDDLMRIETAIGAAESGTSGEIVTLVLQASSGYWLVSMTVAISGALITSAIGIVWHAIHPGWGLTYEIGASLTMLGFCAGLFLTRFSALLRLFTPKKLAADRVHREILAHFTKLGMANTRDRTGVLLMISEVERRVEILADSGIHDKMIDGHWDTLVNRLVQRIREGKAGDGVVELLQAIAKELHVHFPRKDDDTNELNNRVLIGKQY